MELLLKLSPAETHLLLNDRDADLKDLLKYTFMDLLFKGVLETREVKKRTHKNDPIRVFNYVLAGGNLPGHKAKPHEMVFLSPYYKSKTIKILMRHLVKMAFENAGSEKNFVQNHLYKCDCLEGLFKRGVMDALFGMVRLTNKGDAVRKDVKRSIEQFEAEIKTAVDTDPKTAVDSLAKVGSNVLLMESIDISRLKKLGIPIITDFHKQRGRKGSHFNAIYWDDYDFFEDAFETSFDALDTGGGCSGCSGCGGCGGCS